MTKWTALLSGITIASLLLTGCGTANNNEVKETPNTSESQNNTAQTNTTENQENPTQTEETSASTETNVPEESSTTEETTASETIAPEQASEKVNEKTLTYVFNDESKEETAVLKTSDNQPFTLYVLPQFELNAEEPGKDLLSLTGDENIFMRIELLPEDVDWADTEENVKAQLGSISDSITDPGLNITNGSSYEVTSDNDVVTAVLLKDEKAPVRLTLFTTKDADYRNAFLEMAKTIQKQ